MMRVGPRASFPWKVVGPTCDLCAFAGVSKELQQPQWRDTREYGRKETQGQHDLLSASLNLLAGIAKGEENSG